MKKYSRVFKLLAHYKPQIGFYFLFILLSTLFSILSLGMLMPFLQLIFEGQSSMLQPGGASGDAGIKNWITRQITDFSRQHPPFQVLVVICFLMLASIVLKNLFLYLSSYTLNPLKNRVVTRLRAQMFEKILQLPIGYFTEKRKGDLMSRITNDIAEIEVSVIGTLEGWIRDPLQILLNLGVLLFISPQLTVFILLILPVVGFIIGRISRSLRRHSQTAAVLQGEAVSILDETIGGLRVIKAFTAEALLSGRFLKMNEALLTAKNKISARRDLASPLSETLGVVVFCCILLYGGSLVLNQSIGLSGSYFITYLALFYNLISPAKGLSTSFYYMQKGSAAIDRIEEVLNAPVVVADKEHAKELKQFVDRIELRNVYFHYDDKEILSDINLTLPKGSVTALVGSSGAGKSTLADLIPRFHDVTRGQLLIDGIDIREYSAASVRQLMGIVTQEPILFNDTIEANIRLGVSGASAAQVEGAARVANAHHFIENKEDGYHTNIGDRGSKLSGGERQRLTIARAVLKNPPILILDEATSSLDTESEKLVQDAINQVMKDRTTLVIAHRLSTIRHADQIVVLHQGRVAEMGNHETLLTQGGIYRKLVDMQELK
jgi:subfamily B ATP-binding cassette protein MsbA